MARNVAIGIQDFEQLITNDYFYIDKTDFIREWWDSGDSVTLITRPRRFGKTLNLSMVEQFFSVDYANRGDLFEGLSIWENEKYRNIQGTYPVISLSFANVKEKDYQMTRKKICQLLTNLYAEHAFLLASGYLKVLSFESYLDIPEGTNPKYELTLTNLEVKLMFGNMIRDWFSQAEADYNDFIKALLLGDVKAMNAYMNRVSLVIFSYFDTGNRPSGEEPERFYHGFVLGLIVDLQGRYVITSNRESGFGRYDVMLEPKDPKEDDAIILEFKVHDPEDEATLKETVQSALAQIEEKQYAAKLVSRGILAERIRSYGFAFEGKKVLIG